MHKDTLVRENATSLKTWEKGGVDAAERAKGSTQCIGQERQEQPGCTGACRPCVGF